MCSHDSLQVTGLEEGQTYLFRVRAVNSVGVGQPSQVSDPVCAKALPGNHRHGLQPPSISVDTSTRATGVKLFEC